MFLTMLKMIYLPTICQCVEHNKKACFQAEKLLFLNSSITNYKLILCFLSYCKFNMKNANSLAVKQFTSDSSGYIIKSISTTTGKITLK